MNASSVDFSLRVWCADSGIAAGVKNDVLEAVKKRFDAAGIEIPYAYQNLIIKELPERETDPAPQNGTPPTS